MRNVGLPYDFLNPYKKPPIANRLFLTFHGDYRFLSETMTATSTTSTANAIFVGAYNLFDNISPQILQVTVCFPAK